MIFLKKKRTHIQRHRKCVCITSKLSGDGLRDGDWRANCQKFGLDKSCAALLVAEVAAGQDHRSDTTQRALSVHAALVDYILFGLYSQYIP